MVAETVDANQATAVFSYNDPLDRITQIRNAAGVTGLESQTNYSYASPNQVSVSQDQNTKGDGALVAVRWLDGLGRESATQQYESGSGYIEVDKSYDALGRLYTVSNPYRPGDTSVLTTYLYDALGRVTSVTTPDGAVTNATYSGQYQFVTDPASVGKRYWYDAAGRLYNVLEDPNGLNYTTDYRYDPLDNLVSVSQGYCPNCRQRQYSYDALSRMTQAISPENGTVNFNYDANGNLISRTDARGITASYLYDALNRVTETTYSDSTPGVAYTYDDPSVANSTGRLTQVANNNSVTSYLGYDALARITSSSQTTSSETYGFSYSYNLAGALTSETYPSGRVVAMNYDQANRLSAVSGTFSGLQSNYASTIAYAAHGAPAFFQYGNQVARSVTYNNRLEVNSYWDAVQNSPNNYLFAVQENWGTTNNNGNLQTETISKGGPGTLSSLPQATRSYSYDTLNRLSSAGDSSGWSRQFSFDAWGNMWVPAAGNSGVTLAGNTPTSNVFNSNNQISGTNYDGAGNILSANGFTLAYDAENRQTSATEMPSLGNAQELYLYGGDGKRVEKIAPAGNTIYVYDALGQLAAEYNTFAGSFACSTCYLSTDRLGSVKLVTDQGGNTVSTHDFLPFGEEIPTSSASTDIEQRFTGQIRDAETGMDFFNARYFTASLGRFNSADPASAGASLTDPQSWNGYSYVRNSPLVFTDPSGLDPDGPVTAPPTTVTVTGTTDPIVTGDPGALGSIGPTGASHGGAVKTVSYLPVSETPAPLFVPFPDSMTSASIMFGDPGSFDPPLEGWGEALGLVGQNVDAQYRFLGKFAVGSIIAGTGIATASYVTGSTSTSGLTIGVSPESTALWARLTTPSFPGVGRALFAQTRGLLNSNDYVRLGLSYSNGLVFRLAVGSRSVPLPSWVPGLINGTLHIPFFWY